MDFNTGVALLQREYSKVRERRQEDDAMSIQDREMVGASGSKRVTHHPETLLGKHLAAHYSPRILHISLAAFWTWRLMCL